MMKPTKQMLNINPRFSSLTEMAVLAISMIIQIIDSDMAILMKVLSFNLSSYNRSSILYSNIEYGAYGDVQIL